MNRLKKFGLPAITASLMVIMAACGSAATTSSSASSQSTNQNSSNAAQTQQLSGTLVISGSTALQPLAAAAAQEFMTKNPKVSIQVNGGGSGTGLSQVSQGAVQIGDSDVFQEEKKISGLTDNQVAVVGMTAVVNPKVGIKN